MEQTTEIVETPQFGQRRLYFVLEYCSSLKMRFSCELPVAFHGVGDHGNPWQPMESESNAASEALEGSFSST